MVKKWWILATCALMLLLLTGCGTKNSGTDHAAVSTGIAKYDNGTAPAGSTPRNQKSADLFGKVKSISGKTITVYKSSFVPSAGGTGGRRTGGGGNNNGTNTQRDGQKSSNGGNPSSQSGQGSGTGQGRINPKNMFTDETVDIQITDATKIVKRAFVGGKMTESKLQITDLKAGDILSINLKDGSQEATSITLNAGGFGGRAGRGGSSPGNAQN
jgi:hypothetical protein